MNQLVPAALGCRGGLPGSAAAGQFIFGHQRLAWIGASGLALLLAGAGRWLVAMP